MQARVPTVSLGVKRIYRTGMPECIARGIFSPHVNGSKTVFDSGFQAMDSGFQILDSGFSLVEIGPRIPIFSGIPDSLSCSPDSRILPIPESGLPCMGQICIPN